MVASATFVFPARIASFRLGILPRTVASEPNLIIQTSELLTIVNDFSRTWNDSD